MSLKWLTMKEIQMEEIKYKNININIDQQIWDESIIQYQKTTQILDVNENELILTALNFYNKNINKFKDLKEKEINNE